MNDAENFKDSAESQTMEHLLRPLLNFMAIFGLYSRCPCKNNRRVVISVYRGFVLALLIFRATNLKEMNIMLNSSSTYYAKLSYCLLFVLSNSSIFCTVAVLWIACSRKKGLPSLLESWQFNQESENSSYSCKRMCVLVRLCVGISALVIVSGMVFYTINVFNMWGKAALVEKFFMISLSFAACYQTAIWILSVILVLIVSIALSEEFKAFNDDLKSRVNMNGELTADFRLFRRRHQRMCQKVERTDNILSPVLGIGLMSSTVQLLLSLYLAVWDTSPQHVIGYKWAMGHWAASSLVAVFIYCACGIIVQRQVYSIVTILYSIDVSRSGDLVAELNMLWFRLSGESIGLTAMKMFTINKSTILTICGLLLSYYLVFVQFQTASISPNVTSHNNTSFSGDNGVD